MRYVEIVTGRARQRGIGGNHEAKCSSKSLNPPRSNGVPLELRCGVGLAASTPRKVRGATPRWVRLTSPAERDARVGGNVRVPPGTGGGPDSGGRLARLPPDDGACT